MKRSVEESIKKWWNLKQNTFLLPPCYGGHEHVWGKSFDIDSVGCTLCGVVHRCTASQNVVACEREIQNDTSVVCTLTGIVLNGSSMFDAECSTNNFRINSIQEQNYLHNSSPAQKSVTESMSIIRQIGRDAIQMLIYSKDAESCRQKEMERSEKKVQLSFTQFVAKKRQSNESFTILDAIECAINTDNGIQRRHLHQIPPIESWSFMLDHICFCLSHLDLPKQYVASFKNENFKNLVVCFLYLAKNGLQVRGMNVIPKCELLREILPLEVLMWACFKIQSKIITEGENAIKRCVSHMTEEQVQRFKQSCPHPNLETHKKRRKVCVGSHACQGLRGPQT